jgi:putative endonuclease
MKTGVYILTCSNGRFYVGSTNNLERRLEQHIAGSVKSTKNIRPVQIVAFIPCEDLISARQAEYKIKKMKSRKYICKLIEKHSL